MVNANINKIEVHITRASKNPHIEEASSIIIASLSHFKHLATEPIKLSNNLWINKEIIDGKTIIVITIIATIPQEFLIKEMLEMTVLKASFTVVPTIGMKLLMANLAVFIEMLSADCDKMLLHDKTNIKIDITNTVTPVKVFFNIFEKPLKSKYPPRDFIMEKHIQILTIGNIKDTKNFSIKDIYNNNEALAMPPLVTLPVKTYKVAIKGAKHSIVLQIPTM